MPCISLRRRFILYKKKNQQQKNYLYALHKIFDLYIDMQFFLLNDFFKYNSYYYDVFPFDSTRYGISIISCSHNNNLCVSDKKMYNTIEPTL